MYIQGGEGKQGLMRDASCYAFCGKEL